MYQESESIWQGRKLMVLLPAYKTMNPHTHHSLFVNYAKYGPDQIGLEFQPLTLAHEARNILMDRALKNSSAETFIFCDYDMILPIGREDYMNVKHNAKLPTQVAGRLAFERIMSHGRDKGIVSALYFARNGAGKAVCKDGYDGPISNKKLHTFVRDGLIPQLWTGMGFVKIERWVIEKMKKAIDEGKWPDCKPMMPGSWYGYFNILSTAVGEDASFCVRAHEIGINTWLDAGLVCLHAGEMFFGPANTSY
jgi:hypothetical protein